MKAGVSRTVRTFENTLSQADVDRLAQDPSTDARAEVAEKLAQNFRDAPLSPQERELAHDIIRRFARDAEVKVRSCLAEQLKSCSMLPHDVALAFAHDVEKVALPVIEFSSVLTDSDLIAIARSQIASKQVAVARRATVSPTVSQALVNHGSEDALASLVQNPGAMLTDAHVGQITVRMMSKNGGNGANGGERGSLPPALVERLIGQVAYNFRQELANRSHVPPAEVNKLILRVREHLLLDLIVRHTEDATLGDLVPRLHDQGRLTPSLLLLALCQGLVHFFESAIAVLARLPLPATQKLLADNGPLGLVALYRKTTLPDRLYPAFCVLLDTVREADEQRSARPQRAMTPRILGRLRKVYPSVPAKSLDDFVYQVVTLRANP